MGMLLREEKSKNEKCITNHVNCICVFSWDVEMSTGKKKLLFVFALLFHFVNIIVLIWLSRSLKKPTELLCVYVYNGLTLLVSTSWA